MVVIPQQVEHAVKGVEQEFHADRMPPPTGLAGGFVDAQDDVALDGSLG